MRILLWVVLGFFLVKWLFRTKQTTAHKKAPQSDSSSSSDIEPMVQCCHCGLHVPVSEAIGIAPDVVFCSQEHRRLHSLS